LKSEILKFLKISGPVQACNGIALPLYMFVAKRKVSVNNIVIISYGLKDGGIGVALPAWSEMIVCSEDCRQTLDSIPLPVRILCGVLPPTVRRPGI
jgi:hypothetical protein